MPHEHPLAYLLGIEGLALLRAFTGEHDRAFVEARIAEVRALLDDPSLAGPGVDVTRVGPVDGYRIWSRTYDGPNSAFSVDEPFIEAFLDGLPQGDALDAACGTGRVAALLARRGHRVVGVDGSPEMLAAARARLPDAEFHEGDLHRLPLPDDAVDLVVCALALTHVPDLRPVFAEFARALRPGGHVVTSDIHPEWVARGAVPPLRLDDGRPARLTGHRHATGDYVRAALAAGLEVRRCEEPRRPAPPPDAPPRPRMTELGPWELWPWCLTDLVPDAAGVVDADTPVEIVWKFQLPSR